jgi:hypothetical protein
MLRLYLTLLLAIDELLPVQEVNPGGVREHEWRRCRLVEMATVAIASIKRCSPA